MKKIYVYVESVRVHVYKGMLFSQSERMKSSHLQDWMELGYIMLNKISWTQKVKPTCSHSRVKASKTDLAQRRGGPLVAEAQEG